MKIEELEEVLREPDLRNRPLKIVPPDDAHALGTSAREALGIDEKALWWWQAAADRLEPVATGPYDVRVVFGQIGRGHEGTVYLFASDDRPFPWPCVRGTLDDLAAFVDECRLFEFMMVHPTLDWIAFETHHDALLVWRRADS